MRTADSNRVGLADGAGALRETRLERRRLANAECLQAWV